LTGVQELERVVFRDSYESFLEGNPDLSNYGILDGHDESWQSGCPTVEETQSREVGVEIRRAIASEMALNNYTRPQQNWFRNNNRFNSL